MPNVIGRLMLEEYSRDIKGMGSCLLVGFDKLTVAQAETLRIKLKEDGLYLKIVKNRLITRAFADFGLELPRFQGKCGLVFAPEEKAISAAKILREFGRTAKPATLSVIAAVIENQVIDGDEAKTVADMLDKNGVRSMIAGLLQAPGRGIAVAMRELGSSLARCLLQRSEGADAAPTETPADTPADEDAKE